MKENKNLEFETRGKILSASLLVEELLNRIIYNYFIPKSTDKSTRKIFLELFVFDQTFGGKKKIYNEILKSDRYKEKVEKQLRTAPIQLQNRTISDFTSFDQKIKSNLREIIEVRNHIAHGYDFSKAFIALEENEMVFVNKNKFKKINQSLADDYIKLIEETIQILEITKGNLQD